MLSSIISAIPRPERSPNTCNQAWPSPLKCTIETTRQDSYEATMNNMGMERGRMRKEPDNQSSGKATAKTASKTAAAASTFRRDNKLEQRLPC